MRANNLNALDPKAFLKMLEKRERIIGEADAVSVRLEDEANRQAAQRHPQRQFLRVSAVRTLSPTCRCYTLIPDRDRGTQSCAPFTAGQYLSVHVRMDGKEYTRPYSLCSSPKEALCGMYEIAVKAVEGGRVSDNILRTWRIGTEVCTSAPMGTFTHEPLRDSENIVGIAVGSGVTPFVSLAKAIADGTEKCSLTLIYGCRNTTEMLFRDTFARLQKECERVHVHYVLREEQTAEHDSGYITADVLRRFLPQGRVTFFVCGPNSLYARMQTTLKEFASGIRDVRCEAHSVKRPGGAAEAVTLTVHTAQGVKSLPGTTAQTVLEILEEGGVAPETACRSGVCGFCRSRVLSGKYRLDSATDARRRVDDAYGIIHPCCTYPAGDLEIDIAR